MDFEFNPDELVENYNLDGVYEEIISFRDITEVLHEKTKEALFQVKMMEFLYPAI